jgi:hypothetical protein
MALGKNHNFTPDQQAMVTRPTVPVVLPHVVVPAPDEASIFPAPPDEASIFAVPSDRASISPAEPDGGGRRDDSIPVPDNEFIPIFNAFVRSAMLERKRLFPDLQRAFDGLAEVDVNSDSLFVSALTMFSRFDREYAHADKIYRESMVELVQFDVADAVELDGIVSASMQRVTNFLSLLSKKRSECPESNAEARRLIDMISYRLAAERATLPSLLVRDEDPGRPDRDGAARGRGEDPVRPDGEEVLLRRSVNDLKLILSTCEGFLESGNPLEINYFYVFSMIRHLLTAWVAHDPDIRYIADSTDTRKNAWIESLRSKIAEQVDKIEQDYVLIAALADQPDSVLNQSNLQNHRLHDLVTLRSLQEFLSDAGEEREPYAAEPEPERAVSPTGPAVPEPERAVSPTGSDEWPDTDSDPSMSRAPDAAVSVNQEDFLATLNQSIHSYLEWGRKLGPGLVQGFYMLERMNVNDEGFLRDLQDFYRLNLELSRVDHLTVDAWTLLAGLHENQRPALESYLSDVKTRILSTEHLLSRKQKACLADSAPVAFILMFLRYQSEEREFITSKQSSHKDPEGGQVQEPSLIPESEDQELDLVVLLSQYVNTYVQIGARIDSSFLAACHTMQHINGNSGDVFLQALQKCYELDLELSEVDELVAEHWTVLAEMREEERPKLDSKLREVVTRIQKLDLLLVLKMEECADPASETGVLIVAFRTRLSGERRFIESKQTGGLGSDSGSDYSSQRLRMLRDNPSLYKAWLLASLPEGGCGGTRTR